MKIFVIDNNHTARPISWHFLPDSCLTNAGKPFFIPEIFEEMVAEPVLAFKVSRLGKSVASRFAQRYFTSVAVGVHFIAANYMKKLESLNLSPDRARAFDRSLFLTDFLPKENFSPTESIRMMKDGKEIFEWHPDLSDEAIGSVLEAISKENTLKMGDIVLPRRFPAAEVKIGDEIEIRKGDSTILRIEIK